MKDASGTPGLAITADITAHCSEHRYLAIHYSAHVRPLAAEYELAELGPNRTGSEVSRYTRRARERPKDESPPTVSAGIVELRQRALRDGTGQPQRCSASGWRLRIDSAHSSCDATCPLCGRHVEAVPENIGGHSLWVIGEHVRFIAP